MSHRRQEIKSAIVTAIENELGASATVTLKRSRPVRETKLPHVEVAILSESAERINNLQIDRNAELVVDIYTGSDSGVSAEEKIDDIAYQIELAVAGQKSLPDADGVPQIGDIHYIGYSADYGDNESTTDKMSARLSFSCRYQTATTASEGDLSDFEESRLAADNAAGDETIEAKTDLETDAA